MTPDRAPESTVEAFVFELREYGAGQLKKANTRLRLGELSDAQLRSVIDRLTKLQPKYPKISGTLSLLKEQLK
jgi:hypothetical protein